jgi:hypothetical protein
VTRLLKAANVSRSLLQVFPERALLTLDNYGKLAGIEKQLAKQNKSVADFLNESQGQINQIIEQPIVGAEKTKLLVETLNNQAFAKEDNKKTPVDEFPLAHFSDKNKYAKMLSQGDKVQFVFKGLNASTTKEIQDFIKSKLQ